MAFPEKEPPEPSELAVVSWILPQTLQTRTDNARQTQYPAERWVRTRMFGQQVNETLARRVAAQLTSWGVDAVIPPELPEFSSKLEGPYGRASCWSHRHIAYAAGLGTFGLSDGLITPVGKAMRTGSLVARFPTDPVSRPYQDHHAYCLHYAKGTCGDCIPRCPVGAISKKGGHDKVRCSAYTAGEMWDHCTVAYGFPGYACGLCQTAVPCSAGVPAQL
jgi:epoxyqueuosine reductase QueG